MKPRIRLCRSGKLWECSGDGVTGVGPTPNTAYAIWKICVWKSMLQ